MLDKLKPHEAVLIFGDIQEGIIDLPLNVPQQQIRNGAWGLAQLGELFDLPSFAMTLRKPGSEKPTIIREISDTRTSFAEFTRKTPDSFENAEFREAVAATGRQSLIIAGIATEIVVSWIALSGIAQGYRVYLAVDACAGLSDRTEQAALRRLEAAGTVLTSSFALAGELAGDFTASPGKDAVAIAYELLMRSSGKA